MKRVLLALALAAAAFFAVPPVLDLFGLVLPGWQAAVLVLAGSLALGLAGDLPPPAPLPVELPDKDLREGVSGVTDIRMWQRRLSAGQESPDKFQHTAQERLAVLVTERLRQLHGVELSAEPDLARRLLGDDLYDLVTVPMGAVPAEAELARLITRIEGI